MSVHDQTLALGALFQAALAADQLASEGRADAALVSPILQAITVLDADRAQDVYPDPEQLRPGLALLAQSLGGGRGPGNTRAAGHALALIQVANLARRDTDLLSVLRNRLEALVAQRAHFQDASGADYSRRLAGIYVDTLGTLRYRIRVQGNPMHLQNDDTAARIRALFLGGVRAAFLWHQQGGRRWRMLFQRSQYLQALDDLGIAPGR